ncbi:serine hydrolase domain-containing protein [Brevundimonas sp.]|uniref:serine hydrolase domain-containing protein n=1 Tax=Brevundimonas sp. TaxID=1871086 RepID=UPI002D79E1C4|nr:serine hydrolase domain-containing protein [Brevundimonas sp.]
MLGLGGATLLAGRARAQVAVPPALEIAMEQVRRAMISADVPGAGISVVHGGEILAARGLGVASLPFQVPAQSTTLFHLGSVSKQLTAALVLELVEAGAISLDDPVGRHARDLPASFATVPIRNLLSHTGGVPDYEGLPGFEADRPIGRQAFLSAAAALPMDFAPGEAWAYSNTGYVLLGYLLADVTGRTYKALAAERLFRPADLPSARVDDAGAVIPGRAEPYLMSDGSVRHAVRMDSDYSGWPDGGILMSAQDTARWELALQTGPTPSRSTVATLTSPMIIQTGRSVAYGAGWFTDVVAGKAVQYHSGSVPGFLTFAYRSPDTGTAVTVMVNLESGPAGRFMREACLTLAEAVAPGSTPLALSPIPDDAPDLTARTFALFGRGDTPLSEDDYAPEISRLVGGRAPSAMPPNFGADLAGLSWTLVERHDEPNGQVRRYRLSRGGVSRHYSVAYAPDGRIYRVRSL